MREQQYMQTLEILYHWENILTELEEEEYIVRACICKTTKMLYIYTSQYRLHGF